MGKRAGKSLYLGIDLGTTNSKAAVFDYRDPSSVRLYPLTLPQHEDVNRRTTNWVHLPSVVRFDDNGHRVFVGEYPRRYLTVFPDTTVRSIKRLMGKAWRYSVPGWSVAWTPEAIAALILKHIRTQALQQTHDTLNELASVAISIPASFGDRQRQATRDAAQLAGFDGEVNLIDEPSAALIHYLYDQWQRGDDLKPKTVMVYDMGGGTLDVSLAEVDVERNNKGLKIRVISRSRYTELAGTEFDLRLAAYIVNRLKAEGFNMPQTERGRATLFRVALFDYAEKLKIRMSDELDKLYRWHYVVDGLPFEESYRDIVLSISPRVRDIELDGRTVQLPDIHVGFEDFEAVLAPFFSVPPEPSEGSAGTGTLYGPILTALQEASLKMADIDLVLLHGGMTRLPLIKACIAQYFPMTTQVASTPDPMTSVAQGAAIYQASRDGRDTSIALEEPVLFESIFLEQGQGFQMIVAKNSKAGLSDTCQLSFPNGAQKIILSFYHGFSDRDLLLTHDRTFEISLPQPLTDNQTISLRWTVQADRTVAYEYRSPFSKDWEPLRQASIRSVLDRSGDNTFNQLKQVLQSVETY